MCLLSSYLLSETCLELICPGKFSWLHLSWCPFVWGSFVRKTLLYKERKARFYFILTVSRDKSKTKSFKINTLLLAILKLCTNNRLNKLYILHSFQPMILQTETVFLQNLYITKNCGKTLSSSCQIWSKLPFGMFIYEIPEISYFFSLVW